MRSSDIFRSGVRAKLCVLIITALIAAGVTVLARQGHDMRNMPGMQMPAGSPSATPQSSPPPTQTTDSGMPMNMPMNNPTPQAGPSPAAGAETQGGMGNMNMPGTAHAGRDKAQGMSGMD